MDEEDFEDYDREVELALFREYRDVVSQFVTRPQTKDVSRGTHCLRALSTRRTCH